MASHQTFHPTASAAHALGLSLGGRSAVGFVLILAACLALASHVGCSSTTAVDVEQMIAGRTMGTSYSVKLVPFEGMPGIQRISDVIEEELADVNAQMSTYDDQSEISLFNASDSSDWFSVSPEFAAVTKAAQRYARLSEGRFDVTVGPLVDLWGFGKPGPIEELPSDERVESTLQRIGWEKLEVREDPPALRKLVPELRVDLSAIAKGHGVDRLAGALESLGFTNYFVEIGGEVRTRGVKSDGSSWRVGIEQPVEGRRALQLVLEIESQAVATSGDYRNVFRVDGQRISHTIDPQTGRPVDTGVVSATVIADSCMQADAVATLLMATSIDAGMQIADNEGWAAFVVSREGGEVAIACSARFQDRFPQACAELKGEA